MKLKNLCVLLAFLVSVSESFDVPCVENQNVCSIRQTVNLQASEKLNLLNEKNPSEIKGLRLTDPSTIKSFPGEVFEQLQSLEEVNITRVGIERISKDHFIGAKKLKQLNLEENRINIVPTDVVSYAPELVYFSLSKNEITDIQSGALNSTKLEILALDDNKLKSLQKGVFSGAPNLRHIQIRNNRIENIEDGALDLPNLKKIFLSRNHLRTLPPNLLANTPNLELINLEANQLTEIIEVLEKAQKLSNVCIRDNPTLRDQSLILLHRLPKLISLDLKNTTLTLPSSIPEPPKTSQLKHLILSATNLSDSELLHQLRGLTELEWLNLSGNRFTKLDNFNELGDLFPKLQILGLFQNNWDCNWFASVRTVCRQRRIYCAGILTLCRGPKH